MSEMLRNVVRGGGRTLVALLCLVCFVASGRLAAEIPWREPVQHRVVRLYWVPGTGGLPVPVESAGYGFNLPKSLDFDELERALRVEDERKIDLPKGWHPLDDRHPRSAEVMATDACSLRATYRNDQLVLEVRTLGLGKGGRLIGTFILGPKPTGKP